MTLGSTINNEILKYNMVKIVPQNHMVIGKFIHSVTLPVAHFLCHVWCDAGRTNMAATCHCIKPKACV